MKGTRRLPGERGYLAYWRGCMNGAGLGRLRSQQVGSGSTTVGGRSILLLLKTYGERAGNESGEAWPGQKKLAAESGTSETVVRRAQEWAQRNGWLTVIAPAVPGNRHGGGRGQTVRLLVPDGWETQVDHLNGGDDLEPVSDVLEAVDLKPRTGQPEALEPVRQLLAPVSTDRLTPRSRTPISGTLTSGTLTSGTPTRDPWAEAEALDAAAAELMALAPSFD